MLERRVRSLPQAILRAAAEPLPDLGAARAARFCSTTGLGSSAAHARFLACALEERGMPARFRPLGSLVQPPAPSSAETLLVVFSQGWSPNARAALAHADRFAAVVLVTAVREGESPPEKARAIEELAERGVAVLRTPGAEEYETLIRLVGPMVGYVAALRLAESIAPAGGRTALAIERAAAAVGAAPERVAREFPWLAPTLFEEPVAFLAQGAYSECVENLRAKVLEGMLQPCPPVWELLEVAHGPLQQAYSGPASFIALTRADDPLEAELVGRVERCLDPSRHRLLRLGAAAEGLEAIFEHEALLNEALLRYLRERRVDQIDWPGRGADGPLYEWTCSASVLLPRRRPPARLEDLTWPELGSLLAGEACTAVVGLGSTEQHGRHLPFATDTWIAAELARRFCERVDGAIALPVVSLGCAAEHLGFAGTLSLGEATLAALLHDLTRSVARAGFRHLLVFSAHGGNDALLRRVAPELHAAGTPMTVIVHAALDRTTELLHRLAAGRGVTPAAAGHHAGEVETSMLLELAPRSVRRDRLAPGRLELPEPVSALFYPDLRANAPDGTVGDPRAASAAAGRVYLDAWADSLVDAYAAALARARRASPPPLE